MRLSTIIRLQCPVCQNAKIFEGYFDTPERCPACGYYFMRENGYFLPHVGIGYAVTVGVALGAIVTVALDDLAALLAPRLLLLEPRVDAVQPRLCGLAVGQLAVALG